MKLNKLLIVIGLLLPAFQLNAWDCLIVQDDCDKIKISIKLTGTSEDKPNGKIEISFDEQKEFTVFLFSGDANENRLEIKEKTIENLKRGTYNLYVKIEKKCTKHFIVEIK